MVAVEQAYIYKLRFNGPAHFGEDSSGLERSLEYIHSDTLFSAICYGWAAMFGSDSLLEKLLEPSADLGNEPPLRLSSAFIYRGNRYYLPKPKLELSELNKGLLKGRPVVQHAFDEAEFIPSEIWSNWVRGKRLFSNPSQTLDGLLGYAAAYETKLVARNFIPRESSLAPGSNNPPRRNTTPYFCKAVTYEPKTSGLYFFVHFNRPSLQPYFESVLDYLKDNGLGGERSSGYGRFIWKQVRRAGEAVRATEILGAPTANVKGYVTLSLTTPDGFSLDNWRYSLIARRGFPTAIGSVPGNSPRRNLLMLSEGSSLKVKVDDPEPKGMCLPVTDSDKTPKLYRSGLAFAWPHAVAYADK